MAHDSSCIIRNFMSDAPTDSTSSHSGDHNRSGNKGTHDGKHHSKKEDPAAENDTHVQGAIKSIEGGALHSNPADENPADLNNVYAELNLLRQQEPTYFTQDLATINAKLTQDGYLPNLTLTANALAPGGFLPESTAPQSAEQLQYAQQSPVASTMQQYSIQLLGTLGLPITSANLTFLDAWQQAESGNPGGTAGATHDDALFNPFNTTEDLTPQQRYNGDAAPTAVNYNGGYPVKSYASFQDGLNATAMSLQNGDYAGILAALKQGTDPNAAAQALVNSNWGTGPLVQKVLNEA